MISKVKMKLYKTAYSPLYETYVGIKSVYYDSNDEAVITASVAGLDGNFLFREYELERYCL